MNKVFPAGVDPVAARLLSTRANNCLDSINVSTLEELNQYAQTHDLSQVPRCGRRTLVELRSLLDRYNLSMPALPGLNEEPEVVSIVFPDRHEPGEPVPSVEVTMKQPMLDNLRDRMLAAYYDKLLGELSTRARNVLAAAHADHHSIIAILSRLERKGIPLRNCGHKSSEEIMKTFSGYKNHIEMLLQTDVSDLRFRAMEHDYPGFSEKQIQGFLEYEDREGRQPTLWMALVQIADTAIRDLVFFDYYHGITRPRCNTTQLSFKYNLTAERARQIVTSYLPDPKLAKLLRVSAAFYVSEELKGAGFVAMQPLCDRLNDSELRYILKPLEPHAAAELFRLVDAGTPVEHEEQTYLMTEEIAGAWDWKQMLVVMSKRVRLFSRHPVEVPSPELARQFCNLAPDSPLRAKAHSVVAAVLMDLFGVTYDPARDAFIVPPNAVDFEAALYEIIREAGRPLHIGELIEAFYDRYPRYASKPVHSLKTYIFNSSRIECLGKTATYSLAEWGHATETFKTLIRRIVSESDRPLTVSEIAQRLAAINRRTTNASIMTYLHLDREYYSRYRGRYISYGVAGRDYSIDDSLLVDGLARHVASFEEHFTHLRQYVDAHRSLPTHSTEDTDELRLTRWLYNARCGKLQLTRHQVYRLEEFLRAQPRKRIAHRSVLYYCYEIYRLHDSLQRLPLPDTEPELFLWLDGLKQLRLDNPQDRRPLIVALLSDLAVNSHTD